MLVAVAGEMTLVVMAMAAVVLMDGFKGDGMDYSGGANSTGAGSGDASAHLVRPHRSMKKKSVSGNYRLFKITGAEEHGMGKREGKETGGNSTMLRCLYFIPQENGLTKVLCSRWKNGIWVREVILAARE